MDTQIHSDSGRLKQILMNLISNAYKFTPKGGITLFVFSDPVNLSLIKSPKLIKFIIKDTGIGITEDDKKGLFQMFGMVHKYRSEFNMKGTGLGLTITQKLVTRLGGEINLASQENVGTEVTFTIRNEDHKFEEQKAYSDGKCKYCIIAYIK